MLDSLVCHKGCQNLDDLGKILLRFIPKIETKHESWERQLEEKCDKMAYIYIGHRNGQEGVLKAKIDPKTLYCCLLR